MARRTVGRLGVLMLLVLLPFLAGTGVAQAHAYLDASNPTDGETLRQAPQQLRLGFSEHVVLGATRVLLTDARGRSHPLRDLRLVTDDSTDTEAPSEVVAPMPRLPRGAYRIAWQTLSSDDLHRTQGLIVFGVGRAVDAGPVSESLPRPGEVAPRWLVLVGLALGLGGALGSSLLERTSAGRGGRLDGAVRRADGLATAGALAAAVAAAILLAVQLMPSDVTVSTLSSAGYLGRWATREAGLLVLALAGWARMRGWRRPVRRVLLVSAGAAVGLGETLVGHAGAGGGLTRVVATAAHLVAATTWLGALLVLTLTAVLRSWRGVARVDDVRTALRGFALPAAGCVSVMVATGVLLASDTVGSVDAALRTFYGRTLLVKLAVAGVAGLLAMLNHRHVRGRRDLDVPRRTLRLETLAAVVVVAATAVLTASQPATEPQLVRSPLPGTAGPVSGQVADLQESVSLRPNKPGRTLALVDVFDTRRPAPAPVQGVDVAVGAGPAVPAQSLGAGRWSAAVSARQSGRTTLRVLVHRPGMSDVASTRSWTVAPDPLNRSVLVSDAPLAGPLRLIAAVLAVLAALVWTVAIAARRRPARSRGDWLRDDPFLSPRSRPSGYGVLEATDVD